MQVLRSRNVSGKRVLQPLTLTIRHYGNFFPSASKEITKTRFLTLEDALQRFLDDDKIDFVAISPENQKLVAKKEK